METRVAILEHLAQATLATLERIERRFEASDRRFETGERRFETFDRRFEGIDRRFDAVDRRFEAVDRRFEAVDGRFDLVDRKLEAIIAAQRSDFRWLVGVLLASWVSTLGALGGVLGVMAHGFHWL